MSRTVRTTTVHSNTLERPKNAKTRTGLSKTRRMQAAFAYHRRPVGRMYPREKHPRVVLLIDNAPWHRGTPIDEAVRDHQSREFKR